MARTLAPERASVLVRMSPEIIEILSRPYRLEGGNEIRWEFGEPDADGFYEPVVRIAEQVA